VLALEATIVNNPLEAAHEGRLLREGRRVKKFVVYMGEEKTNEEICLRAGGSFLAKLFLRRINKTSLHELCL
jgi:hypothetical protein